ncbi:sensor histidine kinase [Actinoplanes subtropicus]|uniref:sensor histidine kinase n=1 Tax=Actinoplanes subtropicus TaxID=543632 RepID=UPI00068DB95C|nr:sensor histidine kinase [Actinoplanes subtropicus]
MDVTAWWATVTGGGERAAPTVDASLAALLGVLAALGARESAGDHGMRLGAAGFALVVVAAAALAVRRRWPLAALGVSVAATLGHLALGYPYSSILQLAAVAAYSAGAWRAPRVSGAAVLAAVVVTLPAASATGRLVLLPAAWLVAPWLAGVAVRAYRGAARRAAEAEERQRQYRERLLFAQEVHDVVGHSLAVINLQAGVALHVLDRRPERAAEALRAMRQASDQALRELRATLEPLDEPPAGLARVADLVEAVNHGGLHATLLIAGARPQVPPAVEVAGYRIVREALTNVVRHAAAERATVRLDYAPESVTVTVSDEGKGPAGPIAEGRGLAGMRERAGAVGGTLAAGPRAAGGFEVRAELPLRSAR